MLENPAEYTQFSLLVICNAVKTGESAAIWKHSSSETRSGMDQLKMI